MNEEQNNRGHELPKKIKIEADTAKDCERMRALLAEAREIMDKAAREDCDALSNGKLRESWSALSAAEIWLRTKMRPRPGTVDFHSEIDYYLRNEPHLRWVPAEKPEVDAVIANPPLPEVEPRTTPISPGVPPILPGGADGTEPGERRRLPLDIPELGISFKPFYSDNYRIFIAPWRNENDSHVYMLTVKRNSIGEWIAVGYCDGNEQFRLASGGKWYAVVLGLAAFRQRLIRSHRKTWRKARAAARKEAQA